VARQRMGWLLVMVRANSSLKNNGYLYIFVTFFCGGRSAALVKVHVGQQYALTARIPRF
jgi:hypothetical protein